MTQQSLRSRHFLWALPAVVTLLVHTAFVLESHRSLAFQFPLVDAAAYHQQAIAAAAGHPLSDGPFWQPPLYPFVLSLFYRFVTQNYLVVRLLQGLVAMLTSVLVYRIARQFMEGRAAVLAGSLFGLYGPMLFYSSQLLPVGLAAATNAGALVASSALLRRPHWARGVLAGALIGLGAVTVPNILMVVPAVLLFTARAQRGGALRGDGRQPWLPLLGVLAGLLLTVLPVSLRNWVVSGEWVPISTNGGINLYIGNNPQRDATIAIRPGIDWDRLASKPIREGLAHNAGESQRVFLAETLDYMRSQPGAFLAGLAVKGRQLLTGREIPRNLDLYTFRPHSILLRVLAWRIGPFGLPFGILGPLALVGLVMMVRRAGAAAFVAVWTLLYLASVILFFPASRYVMPILPALLVAGAVGARALWQGWVAPGKDWKPAVVALVLAILFALPSRLPTDRVDFDTERKLYTGIALQTRGRCDEAMRVYDEVLRRNPGLSDAWFYRATILRDLKRTDEAMDAHREALRVRPDHYRAMNDLAVMLFQNKKTEEAVALLRKSVELDPLNRQTMKNLSVGLAALGDFKEANVWRGRIGEPALRERDASEPGR